MTITQDIGAPAATSAPTSTATSTDTADKDWTDWLSSLLPTVASTVAPSVGIDPRVAGQTVSQILSIFGLGGGKAFKTSVPQDQAVSQLQQLVAPHISDPVFAKALGKWLEAALEPIQAQKDGKDYTPSTDLAKNWFTDATSWVSHAVQDVGHVVSQVPWQQVAQVGMQALPIVMSLL
jgi:hypothetical protein